LVEKEKYDENTALQLQIELESKNYKHAMMRKEELDKMRINSEFMKDWWTHGLEEHTKNLNIRKENELNDLKNRLHIQEQKQRINEMREKESIQDV